MTKEQLEQRVNVVKDGVLQVMQDGATFNGGDVVNLFVLGLNMAMDETDALHQCRLEYDGVLRRLHDKMDRLEK